MTATTWAPGTQLGPYTLLAPIGRGGMGEVWTARDTRVDRVVAIKRLKPEHAERFRVEARAIAALNHPHICQLYDVGPDYLVMEYVEGRPLEGPMPLECPDDDVRIRRTGRAVYHLVRGEDDLFAESMRTSMEERDARVPVFLPYVRTTHAWASLAQLMNLPGHHVGADERGHP